MKDNKYEKLIAVIGLLSLFCITVGISYSVFSYMKEGTTDNSIRTGKITFIYEEIDKQESGISIENALPISDEVGMKQSNSNEVFNFTIKSDTNSGTSIPYTVTARKKSNSTLDEGAVKIHLTEVNGNQEKVLKTSVFEDLEEAVKSSIPEEVVERILYEGEVPANTTGYQKNFRLRMWIPDSIDFSKDEEGNYPYNGKTFSITVNVYSSSEVVIQKTTDNTLQVVRSSSYKDKLWQYKSEITKIVIKNKLEPMEGLQSWNISESGEGSIIAYYDPSTTTAYIQGNGKIYANSDSSYLFYYFTQLTEIEGLEYLDISYVTDMHGMFEGCKSLESLDLSNWNTSQVTNMAGMFSRCSSLTQLNIGDWNTSQVTDMKMIFYYCSSLTELNISNWDTSQVTDMENMFCNCTGLTVLDISNWDTSRVTIMGNMFSRCSNLTTTINIILLDTKYTTGMFDAAATEEGSEITVNYTAENSELVDKMIATGIGNVKKGHEILPYTVTVPDGITKSTTASNYYPNVTVTLESVLGKKITSFRVNGELKTGNTFKMPAANVTITDVVTE